MLASKSCVILAFTFKFMVHFKLFFVHVFKFNFFACGYPVVPAHSVKLTSLLKGILAVYRIADWQFCLKTFSLL
jgi:hypothetical protein